MATAKQELNELKWRPDRDFSAVEVAYVHRGAPGDVMVITGEQIVELGNSFMITVSAAIPYHRVISISYKGKEIWKRKGVVGD